MLTNGDHSDEDAPLALPPTTAPPPSTTGGLNNKVHDPKHRPPPIQTGVPPLDDSVTSPPPPKNPPPRTLSSLRRSSSLIEANASGPRAVVPGEVVVAASSSSNPVALAGSLTAPLRVLSTSSESTTAAAHQEGPAVQQPKNTSERKPFAEEDSTNYTTADSASIRRDTMVPSEVNVPPPSHDAVVVAPPPRRQESPPAPRTGRTRLSKSDYELLYCKLTDQEMDEMYGEFIGYHHNGDEDVRGHTHQQNRPSGTSAALPPPQRDISTQTGKTRREEAVGIIWRNAHPELLPLYYMFLAPLLVLLNAASYFLHWKPSFIIANAQSNNRFYGEESPFSLQLMAGGVFYFLFTTYLVVLPSCYSALTSGSHEADRKAIAATIAFFVSAFPPWIFEAILVAVPVSEPFAVPSSAFIPHNDHEELGLISLNGFTRSTPMASYISMLNTIVLGLLVLGAPWFVYITAMADLMQKKARKAADEYMRSITT